MSYHYAEGLFEPTKFTVGCKIQTASTRDFNHESGSAKALGYRGRTRFY